MAENHGNVDFDIFVSCVTLDIDKYPLHIEYVISWRETRMPKDIMWNINIEYHKITFSVRNKTFVVCFNSRFPDLTIDEDLCQDPHNMTSEDWTLLTMLYPQITTQYWEILKLLKDYVDKHIEEEYLIENVKCILKGETD